MLNNEFASEIESVRRALGKIAPEAQEDFRTLMNGVMDKIAQVNPNPVRAGGPQAKSQSTPWGVSLAVSGANGSFNGTISAPSQNGRPVWHQVRYSPVRSMTQSVAMLPVTQATNFTVNAPGETHFFEVRSSFDQSNWSAWQPAGSSVSSGLISSAATSEGASFNQTNFAVLTSTQSGSAATVTVSGAAGPLTSLVRQKGSTQSVLPSATIAGVSPGSSQFVAWTGKNYVLRATLASVISDDMTPIGKVVAVDTGAPELPTVSLVLDAGTGAIVAWNVTDGGNDLTGDVELTVNTSTGTGGSPGPQTRQNGKLIAIAPGNPGQNYAGVDTVTASGGLGAGVDGGGTASGGNGGRLTAV